MVASANIKRWKYPRTFHLPCSLTKSDDDKRLSSDSHLFELDEVAISPKMDGENTTVYPDGYIHARSIDGSKHEWQDLLKADIQRWCRDIPDGWRVCGENLWPRHSIAYHFHSKLDFFQVFSIWNGDACLSWSETEQWCRLLGVKMVPTLYLGKWLGEKRALEVFKDFASKQEDEVEGFVVRSSREFLYSDFKNNVAKFVRANHVQTDEHWTSHWKPNELVEI